MSRTVRVPAVFSADAAEWLRSRGFDVEITGEGECTAGQAEGAICQVTDPVDEKFLAASPKLKAVSLCAVGYDNVDLAACAQRGIPVAHTPDILTEAVADLTWALILAVTRRLIPADSNVRRGEFRGWRPDLFLGLGLQGKLLGLIGLGRIGRAVARRAPAFGLSVAAASQCRNLTDLLSSSDIVSLHCPLAPETHHLLNAERFRMMRKGAYVINTARGPLIDEKALIQALHSGHVAGAGLDVFEREPAVESELLSMTNVVLLPHIGSATVETRNAMAMMAARQLDAMLSGDFAQVKLVLGPKASV